MIRSVLFICSSRKIFSDHKNKGFENLFGPKFQKTQLKILKNK